MDSEALTTDRLRFRQFTEADIPYLIDTYNREDMLEFISERSRITDEETARSKLARFARNFDQVPGLTGWWAAEMAGTVVGSPVCQHIPYSEGVNRPEPTVEIGWHVAPDFWGKGIASEMGHWLMQRCASHGVRPIAVTDLNNQGSQAVCRNVGLVPRGISTDYYDQEVALFTMPDA